MDHLTIFDIGGKYGFSEDNYDGEMYFIKELLEEIE